MTKTDKTPEQTIRFYPVNISLADRLVLVCGGNKHALAEINRLMEFGARVDVIAPHIMAEIQDLAIIYGDRIKIMHRSFSDEDKKLLEKKIYLLVFALNYRDEENAAILEVAARTNVLAFGVDQLNLSTFVVPCTIKRGPLKIAVSTDGISPPIEQVILERIEETFINEIDKYTLFLTGMKERISRLSTDLRLSSPDVLHRILRRLQESEEILAALERSNFDEANHLADAIILEIRSEMNEHATT